MRSVGVLRAVHTAACKQTGDLRNADAEHLPRQDVIHTRFQVRDLLGQPIGQPAGDLAKEDAGFRAGVQEAH